MQSQECRIESEVTLELMKKLEPVRRKHICQSLAPYLILDITLYAVNINDLLTVMYFYEVCRKFLDALIVLCLDTGHIGNINFQREHRDTGSLEPGTYSLLLVGEVICIGEHDRSVKILGLGKMEDIELTLILQLMIIGRTECYEHEDIDTVFPGFLLKTRNNMLDILIAESVSEYSYPFVHTLSSGQHNSPPVSNT